MTSIPSSRHGLIKLLFCAACVAVIWLGVLPWVAQLPGVESHLQALRDGHVDAGAMFYSELDPRLFPDAETLAQLRRGQSRAVEAPSTQLPDH